MLANRYFYRTCNIDPAVEDALERVVSNYRQQPTPAAKTTSTTLTPAEILTGIITVNQGGGAASALQLPTATVMSAAFPDYQLNDGWDFSLINISTVAAETASITTNTGWTLVGSTDAIANNATTTKSVAHLRAVKTGATTWTLYRVG